MSVFRNLLMQSTGWLGKPSDWSDIRKDCPANSIALYAGVKSDYSAYDNLGFTATCTGGYKVYIDETLYNTYASGATCTITWSTSGITTGDDITTPTALKAHKIWISPATEGNNITKFLFKRVAGSVQEEQGCLWCHFNIANVIDITHLTASSNTTWQKLLTAITAKNNVINVSNALSLLRGCKNIEYLPILDFGNRASGLNYIASEQTKLKTITLKNGNFTGGDSAFWLSGSLENIKAINCITNYGNNTVLNQMFLGLSKLKKIPEIFKKITANVINARAYLTNAISLEEDTIIDATEANKLTRIECYGTASQYFMPKFKGLRVSNEAPFDNANYPQINVSYTGMDRQALVQLFNDLPYNVGYTVVGSPTINNGVMSDTSTSNYAILNNLFDTNKHIVVKTRFTTGTLGALQSIIKFGGKGDGISIDTGSAGSRLTLVMRYNATDETVKSFTTRPSATYYLSENTLYYLMADISSNGLSFSVSTDNQNWTTGTSVVPADFVSYEALSNNIYFCNNANFNGSFDLGNTSIIQDGITWFNGKAAMTKTLSCVGATGTADLTAEDKDIALAKGWSITIS